MKSYSDFRKEIGLKGVEIEKLTGYTKQGIHNAFKNMEEGKQPSKKFLVCINSVINKKSKKKLKLMRKK
ncbi:hypothetical protein CFSAN002367_21232 [Clostridium botulinum CFSAN002367]|nr:hypothetical protein CFSAN002367_21232 [Clostridium botulinum CFSAN002367]